MSRRAVSSRVGWAGVPAHVRQAAQTLLGSPVIEHADQQGGMSPGCATRVLCADGTRAFVKSVGTELNPDSPSLFRREQWILERLGDHPLWASLRGAHESQGWVTLVLEDIEGVHPDLGDDAVMDRLCTETDALSRVLAERMPAPPPGGEFFGAGLVDLAAGFRTWAGGLRRLPDRRELVAGLVPVWVIEESDTWADAVHALGDVGPSQLQHWDIRHDNLLQRADGELVFLDWGAAAVGPGWCDPLLARLERVTDPWFDSSTVSSPALAQAGEEVVSAWLVGFGSWLAYRWATSTDLNIPGLREFRRDTAWRMLTGAARRLDREPPGDLGG